MDQPRPAAFSADEFFAWAADQPGRFELVEGRVVAMAPERLAHGRAMFDMAIALRTALAARGLGCEAVMDSGAVRIDDHTVYVPDVFVRCGPRAPGDVFEISDPLVIVEVISPSSRGTDTGAKLAGYFRLPSVRHCLIVDTTARVVIHHRRDAAGAIALSILHEGLLALDPPGVAMPVAGFFASL